MKLDKIIDILEQHGVPSGDTVVYLQKAYDYVVQSIRLDQTVLPVRFDRAMEIPKFDDTDSYGHIQGHNSEVCIKDIIAPMNTDSDTHYDEEYTRTTMEIGEIGKENYYLGISRDVNGDPFIDDGHITINDGEDIVEFEKPKLYQIDDTIINTRSDNSFMLMQVYQYPYPVMLSSNDEPVVFPPEVILFSINNDDIFSSGSTVTTSNNTKYSPTYCRISRYETFNDAEWVTYAEVLTFELYKIGVNTIYFQAMNTGGVSNIMSSQIGWAGREDMEIEEFIPLLEITVTDGISFNYDTLTKAYSDSIPTLSQVVTDEVTVIKF